MEADKSPQLPYREKGLVRARVVIRGPKMHVLCLKVSCLKKGGGRMRKQPAGVRPLGVSDCRRWWQCQRCGGWKSNGDVNRQQKSQRAVKLRRLIMEQQRDDSSDQGRLRSGFQRAT